MSTSSPPILADVPACSIVMLPSLHLVQIHNCVRTQHLGPSCWGATQNFSVRRSCWASSVLDFYQDSQLLFIQSASTLFSSVSGNVGALTVKMPFKGGVNPCLSNALWPAPQWERKSPSPLFLTILSSGEQTCFGVKNLRLSHFLCDFPCVCFLVTKLFTGSWGGDVFNYVLFF